MQSDPPIRPRQGVVAVIVRQGRLLVIRRSRWVRAPGAFCFPGGAIEPGETEEDALRRELVEELQLRVEPVRPLWRSTTPWQVELSWWLGRIDDADHPLPQPQEVASCHWLTFGEIRNLPGLLDSNHHFLDALVRREFELEGIEWE